MLKVSFTYVNNGFEIADDRCKHCIIGRAPTALIFFLVLHLFLLQFADMLTISCVLFSSWSLENINKMLLASAV